MKSKESTFSRIRHKVIKTKHVFTENNQVFLKKALKDNETTAPGRDEWSPINFQWIPILKLHQNSLSRSTGTSLDH